MTSPSKQGYLPARCSRSPPTTPRAPCSRAARLDMHICGLCEFGGRTPRGYCAARARMRPFCQKWVKINVKREHWVLSLGRSVEQVGGSHHRSPESPCGTLRMLHAVMQATPAAVAGQVAHLRYVPCEVWGLERACTCGAGVVCSRCAASTCG